MTGVCPHCMRAVELTVLPSGVWSGRCENCGTVVCKMPPNPSSPPPLGVSITESIRMREKV